MTDNEILTAILEQAKLIRFFLQTNLVATCWIFALVFWKLLLYIKNHKTWWALLFAVGVAGQCSASEPGWEICAGEIEVGYGPFVEGDPAWEPYAGDVAVWDGVHPAADIGDGVLQICGTGGWLLLTGAEVESGAPFRLTLYGADCTTPLLVEEVVDEGSYTRVGDDIYIWLAALTPYDGLPDGCEEDGGSSGPEPGCEPASGSSCDVQITKWEMDFGAGWEDVSGTVRAGLLPGGGFWGTPFTWSGGGSFGVFLQGMGFTSWNPSSASKSRLTIENCGHEYQVVWERAAFESLAKDLGGCRCNGLDGDTDGDGTRNACDCDDDGDSVQDVDEDDDEDGTPNDEDEDDDNDGCPDNGDCEDDDEDGQPNCCDGDDDNDGHPDHSDCDWHGESGGCCEGDAEDDDSDGVPNGEDYDKDGDGVPNWMEAAASGSCGESALAWECADDDGDDVPDVDEFEGGPYDFPDADEDGVPDNVDEDDDGDGTPDLGDTDDDADGIPDGEECEHFSECESCSSCEGDGGGMPGLPACLSAESRDTDCDGDPDSVDDDDDDDGVPDDSDTDDDNDGVLDDDEGDDDDDDDDGGGDGDPVCECCDDLLEAIHDLRGDFDGNPAVDTVQSSTIQDAADSDEDEHNRDFWAKATEDVGAVTDDHDNTAEGQNNNPQMLPTATGIDWDIPEIGAEPFDYLVCIPFPLWTGDFFSMSFTNKCVHTLPLANLTDYPFLSLWTAVDLARRMGRWGLLGVIVLRYWGRFATLLKELW